jgi:hypothetical protein
MSGGSYNYLYSRRFGDGDGFLDGLFSMGRDAVRSARKTLAEYTPRETDERSGRPLSAAERAQAEAALVKLEALVAAVEKIGMDIGDRDHPMRELLQAIEWMESGDSGPDDVVQRLIEAGVEQSP